MTSIKRDNNSTIVSVSNVLLDIEGTTSSISFVKDVLFPYVRKHLEEFLSKDWETSEVQEIIKNFKAQAKEDEEKKVEGVVAIPDTEEKQAVLRAVVDSVNWQMDQDRKTKCLKDLQGLIMEEGYKKGELKGHVYDDVQPCLKSWTEDNKAIYIYSSGSVHAQKLLFGHSEKGDLLPMIKGHFDTTVGMKGEAASYKKILEEISCNATDVAFFTDVPKEARAAKEAGILAILVSREGNAPLTEADKADFSVIKSFTEIEFENSSKKRKVCSETDVTIVNKQATNCTVSIEGENEPNNPNTNTNGDVEMMEVEESPETENDTVKDKVVLNKDIKVEDKVQEPNHKDCKENESSSVQEKSEIVEEKNIEEKKTETAADKTETAADKTETAADKTETDIKPIVENNDTMNETARLEKTEDAKEVKEIDNKILNSEGIVNEAVPKKEEKNVREEKVIENPVEGLNTESKENCENKIKDNSEAESKVVKNVCPDSTTEQNSKTLGETESKEKCENKKSDSCESELKVEKDICDQKSLEETSETVKEELKENIGKTAHTTDAPSENIGVDTLQEKEETQIFDKVDVNPVSTENLTPLPEGNENTEDTKESACGSEVSQIDSSEKSTANEVTEKRVEDKKDNVDKPSSEIVADEKLSEMKSSEADEKKVASESSNEVNIIEKDSDKSQKVQNTDEPMEVDSTSELKMESQNNESQKGDGELKSSGSKKESEMDINESPVESRLEPYQSNINADCKSESKGENSPSIEVALEEKKESSSSKNEVVNGENVESNKSSEVVSDKDEPATIDSKTELTVTEEKQDIHVEACSAKKNEDTGELIETESQSNQPLSAKKETLKDEVTDSKVKESEDGSEKPIESESCKTQASNAETNNILNNKEVTKTETEISPLSGNNGLKTESNGFVKEVEEAGETKSVNSQESQPIQDEKISVNGTGISQVGSLTNSNGSVSQSNGSSSPEPKQEISKGGDIAKPVEGKKCDTPENTPMEAVVEA